LLLLLFLLPARVAVVVVVAMLGEPVPVEGVRPFLGEHLRPPALWRLL